MLEDHPKNEGHSIGIKVRNLDNGDHAIEIVRNADALDYPAFSGKLSITGTLTKKGDRLHLHAKAASEGKFECTRCTDPFSRVITAPLDLDFVPPGLMCDPDDPNIHVYDPLTSAYLDITEDVRDALALAIPMKHLCQSNCKGLCPSCGKNLNLEHCACKPAQETSGPWTALKGVGERLRAEEEK